MPNLQSPSLIALNRPVTGRRDERDDAAPLEKAEDAFARALDHGIDILLAGCRRPGYRPREVT
jgi:hypothetical protein